MATAQEKRTGEKKKKKKQEYLPPSRLSHHFAPEKEAAAAVSLLLFSRPFAAGGKNDEGTRKEADSPIKRGKTNYAANSEIWKLKRKKHGLFVG